MHKIVIVDNGGTSYTFTYPATGARSYSLQDAVEQSIRAKKWGGTLTSVTTSII